MDAQPWKEECNLSIMESLLDFCFVQPSRLREKTEGFNRKLQGADRLKVEAKED